MIRLPTLIALLSAAGTPGAIAQELDRFLDEPTLELVEAYDKRLRNAPPTVEVISREEIDRWGSVTLAEALEHILGIHVRAQPDGRQQRLMIRGLDSNYILLRNGAPFDTALRDISTIPLANVKYIEVLKGSHFAIYGANALSGTINIVTFGPNDEGTVAGAIAGQLSTRGVWGRQARRAESFGYSALVTHYRSDVNDSVVRSDRQSTIDRQLGTEASLAPGEANLDAEVTEAGVDLKFSRINWSHLVYKRTKGLGVGLVQSLDPEGEERVLQYRSDLRYQRLYGNGELDLQVLYIYADAGYEDALLFPPGALGGQFPDGVRQSYAQIGSDARIELYRSFRLRDHTLRVGIGGQRVDTRLDHDRRNYTIRPGDLFPTPLGRIVSFEGDDALFDDIKERSAYVVLRDEWRYSNDVTLNLGVRVDDSTALDTRINPRVSLEWSLSPYTRFVALYGESTQSPNLIEITSNGFFGARGDPDLENSQLRMVEVAVEHGWRQGLETSVNVYAYEQDDLIGAVRAADSPNGLQFANLDEDIRGAGLEVSTTWRPNRAFGVRAGWALQNNDATVEEGNQNVARSQPRLEINHLSVSGWNTNITLFGVFDRNRPSGDDRPDLDDYLITNLVFRRNDLLPGLDLAASVQNLFDEDAREEVSSAIEDDIRVFPRRILLSAEYALR